ncbi:hypothetical protein FM101_11085 [Arthrobacter rhombi]|uniref:Uncharacterized protein n=1 Tax=Arthrobacter rhombi TaxID=71253 RepID=A0A1R4GKA5_9MICC|nr:hypothetical protein FM101_11085 [Arthrobacter rhombi]
MLPSTITDEPLQAVPRRDPEILHVLRGVDQLELPQSRPLHAAVNALDELLVPDSLSVLATERPDHTSSV